MNFQVKSIILATTLLLLNTNSVQANWQFTEWGMTAEQLKKVSPVPIEGGDKCPVNNSNRSTNKYDVKYASDWVAGDMIFIACYILYSSFIFILTFEFLQNWMVLAFRHHVFNNFNYFC